METIKNTRTQNNRKQTKTHKHTNTKDCKITDKQKQLKNKTNENNKLTNNTQQTYIKTNRNKPMQNQTHHKQTNRQIKKIKQKSNT